MSKNQFYTLNLKRKKEGYLIFKIVRTRPLYGQKMN